METLIPKGQVRGPILPAFIMGATISLGAKILYAFLCDYAGDKDYCYPSHQTLANKMHCSISSVKNYLRELKKKCLIAIHSGESKGMRTNLYYILKTDLMDFISAAKAESGSCARQKNLPRQAASCPLDRQHPAPNFNLNETTKIIHPIKNSDSAGELADDIFEKVWTAYPRKEAKQEARSVWHELWRNGKLPELEVLLTALRYFISSSAWQRDSGRYIPRLAKWLNGQRWGDEGAQEYMEKENRVKAERGDFERKEREKQEAVEKKEAEYRLEFNAFISRFADGGENTDSIWDVWLFLRKVLGRAPQAATIPDGSVDARTFLKEWQAKQSFSPLKNKMFATFLNSYEEKPKNKNNARIAESSDNRAFGRSSVNCENGLHGLISRLCCEKAMAC